MALLKVQRSDQGTGPLPGYAVVAAYARPALDKQRLGELIDLIGTIGLGDKENRAKDILGRVYEYFLKQFAKRQVVWFDSCP